MYNVIDRVVGIRDTLYCGYDYLQCNNFSVDINFTKLIIDANVNRVTSGGRWGKGINLTAYSFTLKRKADIMPLSRLI